MLFALICEDRNGQEELRKATREAHLAFIAEYDVRLAGPMLSDDGSTMIGSIIMLGADSLAAAEQFAANDPYKLAGLFEKVSIRPFRQVIPAD